jgi:RHS repeat-associated protein
LIYRSGTTPNDYLYTGEQFDAHLGFYYLRARYMNSSTGRFMSLDSFEGALADPLSLHKYLYAGADPENKIDPSGHFSLVEMQIANSVRMVLSSISATIGFAIIDQLRYGGNAGLKSVAFAGLLSIGSFALRPIARGIGGLIGKGGKAVMPLRFSQITCSPFFGSAKENLFRNMSIAQVVKKLRTGELTAAQVPVKYIVRGNTRLIVNTRSSLSLIRAGIPEEQWHLIEVQVLEDGRDIAVRLAKNGLDENGTDALRVGELYWDETIPEFSIWD